MCLPPEDISACIQDHQGRSLPLMSGTACIDLGLITVHDVCNMTTTSNK